MANISYGVNILPKINNTYTLGNSSYKWHAYLASINGQAIEELVLPTVTSSDNDKILKVSSGAWAVGDAPSGLPSVSSTDNGKILSVSSGEWAATTPNYLTSHQDISGKANIADLATVATSGSYNDLSNKPDLSIYLTSVPTMTGATSSVAGAVGLVPAPTTTDTNYFLRGDGTWASADTWGGITYSPYSYVSGSEYYIPARTFMNNTSMYSIVVSSTPNINSLAKYDANKYLYSTTPDTSDNSTKVATTAFVNSVLPTTMTGATSSVAGTTGLVPAPGTGDVDKFLAGDGTYKSGGLPMVILSYGSSTWTDFINAYNNNVIVYCRASSNSNPASGSQTRMAFMAYVNNATSPTNVEFQYYRSVNTHSSTQMGDQVFIYKLDKTSGWSVTTREASIKQITGSGITVAWNNNTVTLTNDVTVSNSLTDTSTTKALSAAKGKELQDTIGSTTMGTTATTLTGAIAEHESDISSLSGQIGSLENLTTITKTSIVAAINELDYNEIYTLEKVSSSIDSCDISLTRISKYLYYVTGWIYFTNEVSRFDTLLNLPNNLVGRSISYINLSHASGGGYFFGGVGVDASTIVVDRAPNITITNKSFIVDGIVVLQSANS